MSYDPDNILAKILRGEIPCHKVYEDADVIAIMDIMPQVDGHTLVIPKQSSQGLLDTDPAVLANVMAATQKVAAAAVKAFAAEGFQIRQYNGAAAGQTIPHLHFHILPMREGEALRTHANRMADHGILAAHAELIRKSL